VDGVFDAFWEGSTLRAQNSAVDNDYLLAEAADPEAIVEPRAAGFTIGHLNYHPDGGQLFFPLEPGSFVVALALPGDDITPADVVAFRFDGTRHTQLIL
jgi:ureidoglycolate hydrolase